MASLDFSFDMSPWQRAFDGGLQRVRNLRPALRAIGEIGEALTKRNIEDGGGPIHWPDLAPATLIARARDPHGRGRVSRKVFKSRGSVGPAHGREARVLEHAGERALTKRARQAIEGAKPLIWTRELLRSITHVIGDDYVDFGSPLEKALTLFFGSRSGKKPPVPARNPFGRTPADNASMVAAFLNHIRGGIKGQA